MYKNYREIPAGRNEIYRFGSDTIEMIRCTLNPNNDGYYAIATDAGAYWTIGTSVGKYGEYAKIGDTVFSVNKGGYMYAKEGTPKGELFIQAINGMISAMQTQELNPDWLFPYRTVIKERQ